ARLDVVEGWVHSRHLWTRRAALLMTLPWTRQNFPRAADLAIRDRVLGWAAVLSADGERAVRQAVAGWLRDLSRHDPERSRAFLATHGARLKPFLRRETGTHP
ncbi:MAG: DNA alkylation repair protein, partial [Albidovulum sp.]